MISESNDETNGFFGVYLLCSKSEVLKFRNKCYIGFAVNPNRRIKQHNRGQAYGGAKKTSSRGPWTMTMVVHGFPNNISALRFEWAWQNPRESRRLRCIAEIQRKLPKESYFQYNIRILSEMLRTSPWNRFSLTIRWLNNDYVCEFPVGKTPPVHMRICYGNIHVKAKSKKIVCQSSQMERTTATICACSICHMPIVDQVSSAIHCLICNIPFHITCLAVIFLEPGSYIPIDGNCPGCDNRLVWGEVIRKKNGFDVIETNGSKSAISSDDSDIELDDDLLN